MDSIRIFPYAHESDVPNESEVYEIVHDRTDNVERSEYISPDKKIESFIQSGLLLQNMNSGSGSYELDGSETDADPDSPEYRDELERDAEKLKGSALPQFFDKVDALETIERIEKSVQIDDNVRANPTRAQNHADKKVPESSVSNESTGEEKQKAGL